MAAKLPNDIFQYSTTGAIDAGYSDHGPTVQHLTGYGSHGVGIFAKSDDRLLFLDSKCYRFTPFSSTDPRIVVEKASPNDGLAFVMVTRFIHEYQTAVNGEMEMGTLMDVLSSQDSDSGGKNSFIPFTIKGKFGSLRTKAAKSRDKSASQGSGLTNNGIAEIRDTEGTIFGFVGPAWAKGMSASGVLCAFLGKDSKDDSPVGGEIESFQTSGEVEVSWAVTGRFHLGFPRGETWEDLDISTT